MKSGYIYQVCYTCTVGIYIHIGGIYVYSEIPTITHILPTTRCIHTHPLYVYIYLLNFQWKGKRHETDSVAKASTSRTYIYNVHKSNFKYLCVNKCKYTCISIYERKEFFLDRKLLSKYYFSTE